ncbi:MAG: RNA-guided endonuclease TnpB family protein, partial [Candidatus Weimeria sp.]
FKGVAGFPRYKKKYFGRQSYTSPLNNGNIAFIDGRHVRLPKLGIVKAKVHRFPPEYMTLKSATVSMESDGTYYVSMLYEYTKPDVSIPPETISDDETTGLDYKSDGMYMDSDGNTAGNPKYYKKYMKQLAHAQKALSRKQGSRKGEPKSSNWKKQLLKVNRIHRKIANSRMDFLQKKSTADSRRWKCIGIEDLNLIKTAHAHPYAKYRRATYDNGFGIYRTLLAQKMYANGGYIFTVDKDFPSTQKCSCCSSINTSLKDDSIRKWICPVCGAHHDRDVNAAINLKNEALRLLRA